MFPQVSFGRELEVAPRRKCFDAVHERVPLELQLVRLIPELQDLLLDGHGIELGEMGYRALFLGALLEIAQSFATSFRRVCERRHVLRERNDLEAAELLHVFEDSFLFSLVPHQGEFAQRDNGHAVSSSSAGPRSCTCRAFASFP